MADNATRPHLYTGIADPLPYWTRVREMNPAVVPPGYSAFAIKNSHYLEYSMTMRKKQLLKQAMVINAFSLLMHIALNGAHFAFSL